MKINVCPSSKLARITGFLAILLAVGCAPDHRARQSASETTDIKGGPHADPDGKNPESLKTEESNWYPSALAALSRGDERTADSAIRKRLLRDPDDPQALELFGDLLLRRKQFDRAADQFQSIAASIDPPPRRVLDKLVEARMNAGQPYQTVAALQQTLAEYPDHAQARYDLVGTSAMTGLTFAALDSLRWMAMRGQSDVESLLVLADPSRVQPDQTLCENLLKRYPSNLRPQYGLAKLDAEKADWDAVAKRLDPVVKKHPDFLPARLLLGRAEIELDQTADVFAWHNSLPPEAKQHPQYWLNEGLWAQRKGQHAEAARAFWEASRRASAVDAQLLMPISQSLNGLGREDQSRAIAMLVNKHAVLRDALKTYLERGGQSQASALAVATSLADLGRIWEAEAWARMSAGLPEDPVADLRDQYKRIRSKLSADTPWQRADQTIAGAVDLSSDPMLSWDDIRDQVTDDVSLAESSDANSINPAEFTFRNESAARGLDHTCQIAPEAATEGHWIYQSVGGGVAAIDFDRDGWPDIAAAMLDGRPLETNSSPNALFRNIDGRFVKVTSASNYADDGFSHGIAVGDFNQDGFADLFDANIGQNRLYRNNGDGTFTDVTLTAGIGGTGWTTSAAIADLDGDGVADIFEVHYCDGPEPYTQACRNEDGLSTCPPLHFNAQADRVFKGRGDGTFVDVSDRWINQSNPGRGLGLVVGPLDETPGNDVYVANDMTVNHLWTRDAAAEGVQMVDVGAIRGVGLSGQSLAQASMGIAAADADGDGDTDLFVTHFSDDYNTYYEQVSAGLWSDRSSQVGLAAPSRKLLGFGTQWMDLDNNGSMELLVTNGHVDDVHRSDVSYRMPPQLFWRSASGRFTQIDRDSLGDYFRGEHLGRALIALDANRDGKLDALISHLYDPVALLINHTSNVGDHIQFELVATESARDAIGAVVTVSRGNISRSQTLLAGDGYMSSNERIVHFGLASASPGDSDQNWTVAVRWPSGKVESFGFKATGKRHVLVEGSGEPK